MPPPGLTAAFVTLALLTLGSCTVYAPMQPVAPAVRQARQAEFMASLQPTGRVEVTGAYSPASRVLVTGGVTGAARLHDAQFLETAQYEVGMGYYQPLGQRWVLSGLGGFGQAYSHRRYEDLNIGFGSSYSEYEARYRKEFIQLGGLHERRRYSWGVAYRLTRVHFDYLHDADFGPLPLSSMVRHELAFSQRITLRPRWQLVHTVGGSFSGTPPVDSSPDTPDFHHAAYEANRNLLPAFVLSLGVVYRLGPVGPR